MGPPRSPSLAIGTEKRSKEHVNTPGAQRALSCGKAGQWNVQVLFLAFSHGCDLEW